jgi:hypothetical protein
METPVLVTRDFLTAVNVEIKVFCDVTPCGLVKGYQSVWETCYFHFESRNFILTLKMAETNSSEMLVPSYQTTWHQTLENTIILVIMGRSQWSRSLRSGSAAARLLKMWVLIPPGAWMSVSFECCVLSGRGLCDGPITRPEESSIMRRLWPTKGCCVMEKKLVIVGWCKCN